jgi:copper chaperone CopZ
MRTHVLFLVSAALVAGCSPTQKDASEPMPEGVTHQATAAERAAAHSRDPLTGDTAVLYVNGLGCPLCATNIDKQLMRLPGVSGVQVDLSDGKVTLAMGGKERPSPHQISEAVEDAGFTLVKVEQR